MTTTITSAIKDGTMTITMSRGERNLLDADMTVQLVAALRDADAREDVKAVVLTGAGDCFCGGADGGHIRSTGTAEEFAAAAVELFELLPALTVPVIAAVGGDALAGGFGLMVLADIIVAAEGSRVGTIEASLGTWPAIAQTPALKRWPTKLLVTNILTGEPIAVERAERAGLIDEVVPATDVLARAHDWARRAIAAGDALAVGRPSMYQALDSAYGAALRDGGGTFTQLFRP